MTTDRTHLIIGASLAGAKAAETLRAEGFDGPLVMIGEENERPYERPQLSKDYLLGKAGRETIYVHPQQWYAEHDVRLRLGVAVTGIDPGSRQVRLADGSQAGQADGVRLADGSRVEADIVIAGVGITPNSELASAAGLETGNGIMVNARLRSSDPDIYAAGDVANAFHPRLGRRPGTPLESLIGHQLN